MEHDNKIIISVGQSRQATHWHAQEMTWSEFTERLKRPVKTAERYTDYMRLKKSQQDDLKDVGGYVAGRLKDSRRRAGNVLDRSVVALDADSIPAYGADAVLGAVDALGCAYAVTSTRKHCPEAPRLRILIPLSRPATADEYEPIARKLAELIGMAYMDPTTFQANRLMYWPSTSSDAEYIFRDKDGDWADTDGILGMYADWHDVASWPEAPGQVKKMERAAKTQGDPTEKKGAIGAFCRSYGIEEALDKFLPGSYERSIGADRWTYAEGSTAGGAVVYDNKFLYSHHATDPASNQLCNAFDLIRLHKFADLDDGATPGTPTPKLPSFKAMSELAFGDAVVQQEMLAERRTKAAEDFTSMGLDLSEVDGCINVADKLEFSKETGKPVKTIDNALKILEYDPQLRGAVGHDEMANKPRILKPLPWRSTITGKTWWEDSDAAALRHHMEKFYQLDARTKTDDAFVIAATRKKFHEVRDYLNRLVWDGTSRLDRLLVDYLGAEDTPYVQAVTRKTLVAAVARIMTPGVKFDTSLSLIGPQGAGKTTLLQKLGRGFHVEIGLSFKGKETSEIIQGYWIVELGELKGMTKAEDNDVKQFLSRTEDVYREAYGRFTKAFPRQCVFIGTSNNSNFLKDSTGSRRFWPVDLMIHQPTKNVWKDFDGELDQIWAEAKAYWMAGEPLNLSKELEKLALAQQEDHREINPWEGQISEWLDRKLPPGYQHMDLQSRRNWWFGEAEGDEQRDRVCALEVWCELFNGDPKQFDRRQAAAINSVLDVLPGWKKSQIPTRFGPGYGSQRGYFRMTTNSTDVIY